jgi:hypothetical protein
MREVFKNIKNKKDLMKKRFNFDSMNWKFVLSIFILIFILGFIIAPALIFIYSAAGDIFYQNATEGTNLGARLSASVLSMDFNSAPELNNPAYGEPNYVKDGSVYNNFANILDFNATFMGCKVGNCLQFDGVNDAIVSTYNNTWNTANYSWSGWINLKRYDSASSFIFGYGNGQVSNFGLGILLVSSDGVLTIKTYDGALRTLTSSTPVNLNTWYHVAVNHYATDTRWNVYQNGALVINGTAGSNLRTDIWNNFRIADPNLYPGAGFPLKGYVDEVMVFNRTLTATEISYIYNNQSAGVRSSGLETDANLVSYWYLDTTNVTTNYTGAVTPDNLGRNNGTLTNYPTANTRPTYNATGGYDGSGAYTFDGVDDYIQGISQTTNYNSWTMSAWVKTNSSHAGFGSILSVNTGTNIQAGIHIYNNNIEVSAGVNRFFTGTCPISVTNNNWHQITAIFKFTDGVDTSPANLRLYIDGQSCTLAYRAQGGGVTAGQYFIGSFTAVAFFNGSIDNILYIPYEITSVQVQQLYNGTLNNSNYIGKYAKQGDFQSGVFYNSTSTNWNITLSQADSSQVGSIADSNGINLSHPNLVVYLPMDGNFTDRKGTIVVQNMTGIIPNNASGISSGALQFNGNTGLNATAPSDSFNATFSFWFKPTALSTANIFGNRNTGCYDNAIYYGSSTNFTYYGAGPEYNTRITPVAGQWQFVTLVANNTQSGTGNFSYYLNGVLMGSSVAGAQPVYLNRLLKNIGSTCAAVSPVNGTIDEITYYNKTFSPSEVMQLYKSGLSQKATTNISLQTRTANTYNTTDASLVGFWAFNNDTNVGENSTLVVDLAGRNNATCNIANCVSSSGIIGNGLNANSTFLVKTNNATINFGVQQPFTIVYWQKFSSAIVAGTGVSTFNGVSGGIEIYYFGSPGYIGTYINNGGNGPSINPFPTQCLNQYSLISWTRNSTNSSIVSIYCNGANASTTVTNSVQGADVRSNYNFTIGARAGAAGGGNIGSIDEVRIYNRTLSGAEILSLYQLGASHISDWTAYSTATKVNDGAGTISSTGKFMQFKATLNSNDSSVSPYVLNYNVSVGDFVAPNATLLIANNSQVNNLNGPGNTYAVNFTANLSDNMGVANATLNIYNSTNVLINQTTTSFAAGTLTTTVGIVVNLIDGVYTWFYNLFDFGGNSFTTQNNTLTTGNLCTAAQLASTCTLNRTYYFKDGETISGTGNLIIGSNGSIANYTNLMGVIINFSTITIQSGGNITGANVTIYANNLTINSGGKIHSYALGNNLGRGAGAGVYSNEAFDTGGGAYGGRGGDGYNSATLSYGYYGGMPYGSALYPQDFGSSGANSSDTARIPGAGGGIVSLFVTNNAIINGIINVSGGDYGSQGDNRNPGGGSGGSILMNVSNLSGSGAISSIGGLGGNATTGSGGCGSGGRIAVYYNDNSFSGVVNVSGGIRPGTRNGGSGTYYLIEQDSNNVYIKGSFETVNETKNTSFYNTNSPLTYNFTNINLTLEDILVYPSYSVNLISGDNLTQLGNFIIDNYLFITRKTYAPDRGGLKISINITAVNFNLNNNSYIDLTGLGYPSGNSTAGWSTGIGNSSAGSNYNTGGAGHGGNGTNGTGTNGVNPGGISYGSLTQPVTMGSGAADTTDNLRGGTGGGAIKITTTGIFTLKGNITVDGSYYNGGGWSNRNTGGGSGGSIWLNANSLAGNGNLSARGGNGSYFSATQYGGNGAGGRIAVQYSSSSWTGSVNVSGGINGTGGVATLSMGTYYLYPAVLTVILNSTNVSRNDTSQNLTANITTNQAGLTAWYRWYKNNVLNLTTTNLSVLTSRNLTYGDVWKVGVIVGDGRQNSSEMNSSTITILDVTSPNATLISPANNTYTNLQNLTALGGTITYADGYTIHTFTSNGAFNVTSGFGNIEVLVVAGGGAGGGNVIGGGGGAGGIVYNSFYLLSIGNYSIVVGSGGTVTPNSNANGGNGDNSSFSGLLNATGGGGGAWTTNANNGGCGGGGGANGGSNGRGIGSQGYNGGSGFTNAIQYAGGGGGGMGSTGGNANLNTPGNGGNGIYYPQFVNLGGFPTGWFSGGGSGGGNGVNGIGGNGGGGNSSKNAVVNTGGGGGSNANGSSGIVIVRYATNGQLFRADITDESSGIANATLNIYNQSGLFNSTFVSFAAGTLTTSVGIVVNIVEGVYTWFYNLFDFAGNPFVTTNNTVTVDITKPIPYFISPTPNNDSGSNLQITIKINVTEINPANATLDWGNETSRQLYNFNLANFTQIENGVYSFNTTNKTGLLAGQLYYYNITVCDLANNCNTTETRLVKGNTGPVITVNSDTTSTGNYSSLLDIIANITVTDNEGNMNFAGVYLFYNESLTGTLTLINATILTASDTNNFYLNYSNLSQGLYRIFANATDLVGELTVTNSSQNRTILIDRTLPNATLNTPINGTISNNLTQNYTANLSDNLGIANATLNIYNSTNSLVNSTIINFAVGVTQTTVGVVVNLIDGIYTWFYNLFDWAGNQNYSGNNTITLDTIVPLISNIIYSPSVNDSLDPSTNVSFNVTLNDSWAGVEKVILQFYNGTWNNYTMNNVSGTTLNGVYSTSVILDPINNSYAFNIWYNDSAGNSNQSVNQTFSANWDCTWNIVTTGTGYDLGQTGGFYQNKPLGNVTIFNTGDVQYANNNCSITFARTAAGAAWYTGTSYIGGNGRYINLSRDYYDNGGTGVTYAYNGSSVSSLIINASQNKTLEITANFPTLVTTNQLIENPVFPIFSSINDTENRISNINITAKMIVTPGAYLETGLDPSTQKVYLLAGNFSISGYVKDLVDSIDNPQNNTAYNVSFNISIPSELQSLYIAGDLNRTIEILNNTNKNSSNLTFQLTSSNIVSLGVRSYTFYTYASGYENSTGNLSLIQHSGNQTTINSSATISFACYSLTTDSVCPSACTYLSNITDYYDPDCTAPTTTTTPSSGSGSSGGGGGGGGGATTRVEKSEASFELLRGENQEFNLEIKNKYPWEMKNLKISVSGINAEYIKLGQDSIDSILGYSSKNISVRINAPAYFTGKKYTLSFEILGSLDINNTASPFLDRKLVTLYIVEVSRKEADRFIVESQKMINEMNQSNMSLEEVLNLFEDINQSYYEIDFIKIKNNYELIKKIYTNAFDSKAIIEELTLNIQQKTNEGISTLETQKMLYIAQTAYKRGDYALALERLKEAKLTYALEVKGEFNLIATIKNNPVQTFEVILGLGVFGFGSTMLIRYRLYKKKLRILSEEEILLLELMKMVQKQCFEENRMSMEEYEEAMAQYEMKLSETIEDRIKVETKITNMLRLKGKRKALDEEKKRLIELIKKVQDDYLNKNKIETRIYENMLKVYSTRLSDVDEQLAYLDAQEALKNQTKLKRIFRI